MISSLPLRFTVVREFQSELAFLSPGTPEFEEADIAAALATNPRRTTDLPEFFRRNLRRDARRTYRRRRRPLFLSDLARSMTVVEDSENECGVETLLPAAKGPAPPDCAAASELELEIRRAVDHIPGAGECLNGMLANERPADTAERIGTPVHRVHYVRRQIREITATLMQRYKGDK